MLTGRRILLAGIVALMLLGFTLAASATSIDFSATPPYSGSDGVYDSLNFGILTITAITNMGDTTSNNPLYPTAGHAGYIFWGDLGISEKNEVKIGLGVQDKTWIPLQPAEYDKKTGDLKKEEVPAHWEADGSKGISGDGGDDDEALIFSFTSPFTAASSIKLTLIGLDGGKNGDVIDMYLDFMPLGNDSEIMTIIPVNISAILDAPSVLDFSTLGLPTGVDFGSFAVRANEGHFGVGGIEYTPNTGGGQDPIPEPGALILLGSGLLALVGTRILRRR